jgi:hypothetical protein
MGRACVQSKYKSIIALSSAKDNSTASSIFISRVNAPSSGTYLRETRINPPVSEKHQFVEIFRPRIK